MAFGVMRRPAETFGVLSCFSRNLGPLGLGLMLGAIVENALDGKKEFGKVAAGPFCEPPNKAFNHEKSFTV